ncbi:MULTISPECIES: hypothetical protein [Bacillus]|uniref:Uncharacterized protein n=1 Tax=Bacillus glycinifermentans TaxID=1664069 RepID=A0A0T6BIC5_9BACI|nr:MULTISPECIES: hypothetical protein [Bacillus]KRT87123.1 hypothetical protein AB447_209145 [Bacillus glycinifermentans]MEC0341988.1 hypothetical protein [Bacillus sonorensis]MEC0457498.1 hypothetical protein [Bacillus sonorensis]MEC0487175.1 hypothetical protein [Bacillus glycinifermentans]MEC0530707.1 hypothetical protein [Bacillus sonorensis]
MARLTHYQRAFNEIMRISRDFDAVAVGEAIKEDRLRNPHFNKEEYTDIALSNLLQEVKRELEVILPIDGEENARSSLTDREVKKAKERLSKFYKKYSRLLENQNVCC